MWAKRDATERKPGWAIRFGQAQGCECSPWKRAAPAPVCLTPLGSRRRAIWDLGPNLHCSIIGTCLTTDALRRLMRKIQPNEAASTDHRLHGLAVGLCGKQDVAARLINKALDEEHRVAVRRFDALKDEAGLRAVWAEALAAGDIPGAYWAVLTHPVADQTMIADVFGDVHMLSHLVGASNRADIRRLAEQEREISALRATVARQQQRLRDDLTERDARIRNLQDMMVVRAQQATVTPSATEADRLIALLQSRLGQLGNRIDALEDRRAGLEQALRRERERCDTLEHEVEALRREIAEADLAFDTTDMSTDLPPATGNVLYVGGRSGQTTLLRDAAARAGMDLQQHDAEQNLTLLSGLVGRADLVVFPVDCVSHEAALAVKRLCRQFDRPFRPLRSTGAASLLATLRDFASATQAAE